MFRGEGGEIERRPNKPTQVWMTLGDGEALVEDWPALLADGHQAPDTEMDTSDLIRIWRGESGSDYATASITGTLAIALRTMGRADSMAAAQDEAEAIWAERDKGYLPLEG